MNGQLCDILSRSKEFEAAQGELAHFELSEGTSVDAICVARDRNWTVYCYDPETRQALFLKLPDDIDLGQSAFSYVTQFEHAQKAMLVSFDELTRLSNQVSIPDNLVLVHSIGRCGSTLVSKIFSNIPKVWSISEPDPLMNLAAKQNQFQPNEITALIQAAIRLSYRPPIASKPNTYVVKLRSQSLFHLEPLRKALPKAENLFLYRDAFGWTQSVYKFAQSQGIEAGTKEYEVLLMIWNLLSNKAPESDLLNILDAQTFPKELHQVLAAAWALNMNQIQYARNKGHANNLFSYAQLNTDREGSVRRILSACKLPATEQANAMKGYDEDSQKGTAGARSFQAVSLSKDQLSEISTLLENHPAMGFGH